MEATAVKKSKKKEPVPTSARKRPNKKFILEMVKFRGHMTCNEKTMLEGLNIKNLLQRINNRAFDDAIKADVCGEMQKRMKAFVKEIDALLDQE